MITFVCGGVRSGKSSWGEARAESLKQKEGRLIYLATAKKTDEEMKKRIRLHQNKRAAKNVHWVTIEKQRNLADCVDDIHKDDVVFLDCLTIWLSQEMFTESPMPSPSYVKEKMMAAIHDLEESCCHLLIISNDLFHESMPEDRATYLYVKTLGELHQRIVRKAKNTIKMEHGQPVAMKGRLEG